MINLNYIDVVIILIVVFFVWEGWRHGLLIILADFLSFFGSLLLALRFYKPLALIFTNSLNLSSSTAKALAFLAVAIVTEFLLGYLSGQIISMVSEKARRRWDIKFLAIFPAVGEAFVLLALVITLLLVFPVSPKIKEKVTDSYMGSFIAGKTQGLEAKVNEVFGGVIEDTITYLTIEPASDKRLELNVSVGELKVDEASEVKMAESVNRERRVLALDELRVNQKAVLIARKRAEDMWLRKYFGHITPDGENAADFLDAAGISYTIVGENIALAPTAGIAHKGLMNSEGHRANILSDDFSSMGIGVIDNGVYGKIFVEIFLH